MKVLKPLYSVFLFVSLLVVVSLFFYLSTTPTEGNGKSQFWTSHQSNSTEYKELARVLKKASRPDRTVILTTLYQAWASPGSVIDLFLESFRIGEGTEDLLNHLVIVAMDHEAFHRCTSIHLHCFSFTTMTPDYIKLKSSRIRFLRMVLELGYNFLFTDADVMWLRNPFPHFTADAEIIISCDFYTGNPKDKNNKANSGFSYVKSDELTIEFYKYWYMAMFLYPNFHDQSVFEIVKHERIVYMNGLRIKYLDTSYFGGFCQASKDMNKLCTVHSSCCVGLERKFHDLRLVLEDWRNYTALPPEENRLQGSFSSHRPWRVPSKCR